MYILKSSKCVAIEFLSHVVNRITAGHANRDPERIKTKIFKVKFYLKREKLEGIAAVLSHIRSHNRGWRPQRGTLNLL